MSDHSTRPTPGLSSGRLPHVQVAFLGLGLIGGSLARALRAAGGTVEAGAAPAAEPGAYAWRAVAWTPSGRGPAEALAAGVVDAAPVRLEEALAGSSLVVLAAPATACLDLLDRVAAAASALAPGAVITDVASTKGLIMARADGLGLRFVGGHPMAGREIAGFGSATPDLFVGRPWVIVAPAGAPDEEALARVEALARAARARPIRLAAAVHDRAVAAISHLPLVAAAALAESVAGAADPEGAATWAVAAGLAAGGWRDMTRLARGDASMGAGIAATNAPALAAALRAFRARLDEWIALLDCSEPDGVWANGGAPNGGAPDEAALRARFEAARQLLAEPPPGRGS